MVRKMQFSSLLLAVAILLTTTYVHAQGNLNEESEKTYLTFSQPVEIPGATLAAGTYKFEVVTSWAGNKDIIRVSDKAGTHVYATIITVPNYRPVASDKTVVMYRERVTNASVAVRDWYYPGHRYGHEFVYPRSEAAKLAAVNRENVPSVPDETAKQVENSTTAPSEGDTHVTYSTPDQRNVEASTENQPSSEVAADNSQAQQNLVAENRPLPKTASLIPLIAFLGIVFLGIGLGMGILVGPKS
jgi:hypothetical protein